LAASAAQAALQAAPQEPTEQRRSSQIAARFDGISQIPADLIITSCVIR
jgi:hypothetical protein